MFTHLSPSSSAIELEENKTSQLNNVYQVDLLYIRNILIPQILSLTHTDSGRILTSKLYDCLEYLDVYNHDYNTLQNQERHLTNLLELKYKLKKIVLMASLSGLDEIESELKDEILELSEKIHHYADLRKRSEHLDTIADLNRWSTFFYYGTIVAKHTTKGLQTFFHVLPGLLKNLGKIFPPIIITLDATKNLFDLIYAAATKVHLVHVEKKMEIPISSSPFYNKGFFVRFLGNLAALTLNIFAILIFTGILATPPLGWALSVGVIGAEWLANTVIPAWHAWKNYKNLRTETLRTAQEKKIKELTTEFKRATNQKDVSRLNRTIQDLRRLQLKTKIAEKHFHEKQASAFFGLCSITGSILLACAIFAPPLYLPALALLVIPAVRNTVKFVNKYLDKNFSHSPQADPDATPPIPFRTQEIEMMILKNDTQGGIYNADSANTSKREASPQSSLPSLTKITDDHSLEPVTNTSEIALSCRNKKI